MQRDVTGIFYTSKFLIIENKITDLHHTKYFFRYLK
ncbi:hypothetical protein SPAB_01385 [Salmonella enterica subsp. enterica serovar Paratyphi B str. SPB7]|uniref:Uncharacterized protein n=1 Tax=Salmonella paratyphi B (strain ATCC BAA-1250 / SPB7) TaxID=1016998 RepID=A0A6C6YZU9_SALPB|nr:hypothetical protein SPAB_01385 [Salmonella enterica subsp. enterica serovar Paratyphi B str. SPB7]